MTKLILSVFLVMMFTSSLFASDLDKHFYKPNEGYVSDNKTAIKIAEVVLSSIYGQEKIDQEKPLNAVLKDGTWEITGTLNCPGGEHCLGGVAIIEISKDDGRVLRVSHGQ